MVLRRSMKYCRSACVYRWALWKRIVYRLGKKSSCSHAGLFFLNTVCKIRSLCAWLQSDFIQDLWFGSYFLYILRGAIGIISWSAENWKKGTFTKISFTLSGFWGEWIVSWSLWFDFGEWSNIQIQSKLSDVQKAMVGAFEIPFRSGTTSMGFFPPIVVTVPSCWRALPTVLTLLGLLAEGLCCSPCGL